MQAGGIADVEALFAAVDHAEPDAAAPGGYRLTDLPCFSHPFYKRDPRAAMLVDIARSVASNDERLAGRLRFLERVDQAHGGYLNIFAALVLLCDALDMPRGSAAFLHSLGRVAGWVAHAAEQRLTGAMLRPRARYVGGAPA
jgi:citrate synthase